tara:strand:- start:60870 stop:62900 length:2031 start_codon:yes stop_codon:yes gene_type:complete
MFPNRFLTTYNPLLFILIYINISFSQVSENDVLSKLNQFENDSLKIKSLLDLGDENYYLHKDGALIYYQKALKLSKNSKSVQGEAYSLYRIGKYFNHKGESKKSLEFYLDAINIYKSINDERGVGTCYKDIAYSFSFLNSLDKSIEYYTKALAIFKRLEDKIGIADVYDGFGNLNYDQNNYVKAKEYYLKALKLYEEVGSKEGVLTTYINLGNAIADNGELDEGLEYYFKSIKLSRELNDIEGIAINYLNIGDCYLVKGDYKKAIEYFHRTLEISDKYNFNTLYSTIYSNIAEVHLRLKDYHKTIFYVNKSFEKSEDIAWAFTEFDNHFFLSEAYAGLGNYKKAYDNHKVFKNYTDSIYNAKKSEQIIKLDVLYELENKQHKIEFLTKNEAIKTVELKNQKKVSYTFVGFSAFFLLLLFLLVKQRKYRNKAYGLLSVQKQKAEESDKLKSSFLANMSHEIRTPMSAIMGFSSLLKNKDLSEEKRNRFLDVINHSGERLMAIINDIIDISKIESNQLKIDIQETNITSSLKEIIEVQKETNNLLEKNNIELKLILPTRNNDAIIKTDETRFSQIINNLINNASKFTKDGIIEVGYLIEIFPKEAVVKFYVKDTGCGIPKNKFDLIFDRFSQAGDKDFKTGNGLGLSICKGLMLKLGGEIWVKSEVGIGTTFYFTLPC